jgi:hypothetical protein
MMYFNTPAGERRSANERCLCKKRNEQCNLMKKKKNEENRHNLNDSRVSSTQPLTIFRRLLAYVWRSIGYVREREEKAKYRFISIIAVERKKF